MRRHYAPAVTDRDRLLPALLLLVAGCANPPPDDPTTTAVSSCSLDATDPVPLHPDGTRLRDGAGREVLLRGVNAGGRSKFAPYMPFEHEDATFDAALAAYLDRAATWGMTVVRVPFTWAALEPTDGTYDEAWLAKYDALVDGAWARDIAVIVEFHQDIYGEYYCGDGFPPWTVVDPGEPHHDCPDWSFSYFSDEDVSAAYDDFWSDARGTRTRQAATWAFLAGHFADHPGVVGYEVFNEPGWGTADKATWAVDVLTPYYTDIAASIADIDPDALVFFDATGIDAVTLNTELQRPEGENLVFAPHFYDAAVLAGGSSTSVDVGSSLHQWANLGEDWQVPVLLGEYGVDADLDVAVQFMEEHYAALDDEAMNGTWWEYSVSWEYWNGEDLSVVDGDGEDRPGVVDVLARPVPRAVAGTDVRYAFADGALTMDFTPAEGVTEITLPTRAGAAWVGAANATVTGTGACADVRADRVYVQAYDGATTVHLVVGP